MKTGLCSTLIATIFLMMPPAAAMESTSIGKAESASQATLVIYRPRFSPPMAFRPMITINGIEAFYLPGGYHATLNLDAGEYHVLADWRARHGVRDVELTVSLEEGKTSYLKVANSLDVTMIAFNSVLTSSGLNLESAVDLSGSVRISRWHPKWVHQAVGGFTEEETLNQRYEIFINNEKVIEDFEKGNHAKKLEIARYLLHHQIYEEAILIVFEKEVLDRYQYEHSTKIELNQMAYICKYLASSKMLEFRNTIEKVAMSATSKKLRNYGERYLLKFYGT